MTWNPDIIFMTEYIKNVLYFATVRQGKTIKSTADTHYFCIDDDLVYENYYSDFGPLNLGCVYKYCMLLNEKVKIYLNKQIIVHYTSIDPKKKANAAFLLGCYGVLYLKLSPRDALKPLLLNGQSYRPFQDATKGDSAYTITLLDCMLAIKKAKDLGLFNFDDFNYEEYDRLDKIHGGDLNWIVPGKFLAFIGPEDCSVSLYHPPEMYIDYFLENNVKIVIRLNKRLYDANIFNNAGIIHYDLFFPDGSCPPRHILLKFLQISEEADGAIAVHCKAGLGRTGSLIGCYLIKHYRMTAHEAIGWMRICRPGSVIGHQQSWLEQLEAWLTKQGNLYRKRYFNDVDRLPIHNFGVYSHLEKARVIRPMAAQKSSSSSSRTVRQAPSRTPSPPIREQPSKNKEAVYKKGKEQYEWRMKPSKPKIEKIQSQGNEHTTNSTVRSGAGEPRISRPQSKNSNASNNQPWNYSPIYMHTPKPKPAPCHPTITTFRTTNGPAIKNVFEAKNYLLRSSLYNEERDRILKNAIKVTPAKTPRLSHYYDSYVQNTGFSTPTTATFMSDTKAQQRRRLGRSPSPSPTVRSQGGHTRATNTPPKEELFKAGVCIVSKQREGSVGVGSLEARRDAPAAATHARGKQLTSSVRSDERPLATQGDMLNSIKLQRRLRESLLSDKHSDNLKVPDRVTTKNTLSKTSAGSRNVVRPEFVPRIPAPMINPLMNVKVSRNYSTRPVSPKGKRSPTMPGYT